MLRALVLLLALANAGFFAWSRGWLDGVAGVRMAGEREPERLARQVHPESVRLLPPIADSDLPAAAALACLQAGPFDDAGRVAAEAALQGVVPAGRWTDVTIDQPGAWLVYMGRYPSRNSLARKVEELRRRKLEYEEIGSPPELDPGLSLGRFDDRLAADEALVRFTAQGVRAARVVELSPATSQHFLRVDGADAALAQRLGGLTIDAPGPGFGPCAASQAGR